MTHRSPWSLPAILLVVATFGCGGDSRSAPPLPVADLSSTDEALRAQVAGYEARIRALHAEWAAAPEVAAAIG